MVVERTVMVTAGPTPTPAYSSTLRLPSGVLAYPLAAAPASLSPQTGDEAAQLLLAQLYEPLFVLDSTGAPAPAAAASHQVSPDRRTYTVTLRSDLRWSDGMPVTAAHFAAGLCRLFDPASGNARGRIVARAAGIEGAEDFALGRTPDCTRTGISALDDRTLRFVLAQPNAPLLAVLAGAASYPARPELPPGQVTGNGPYILESGEPAGYVLRRNPLYAGRNSGGPVELRLRVAPASQQLPLYRAGDLSAIEPSAGEAAALPEPGLRAEVRSAPVLGSSMLLFNTQHAPQTTSASAGPWPVRWTGRGSAAAVGATAPPARGLLPAPFATGSSALPFDRAATQKLLAELGYGQDNPPPPLDIWVNREGNNDRLFTALAAQLESAGIPVRLTLSSWDSYQRSLAGCSEPRLCGFNLYWMGWVWEYADPAALLRDVLLPESPRQKTGWRSEQYRPSLQIVMAQQDATARAAGYGQLENILLQQDVVAIPLFDYERTLLVKPGVQPFYPPLGPPRFNEWRVP